MTTWSERGAIRKMSNSRLILILSLILTTSVINTSTAKAQVSHSVTFWERGVGEDYTGVVATIDGNGCYVSDLGTCYTVTTDTDVSFAYHSPLVVDSSKQYVWIYTTSDTNPPITTQEGTVPAGMDGTVFGYYATQYSVSFSSNPAGAGTTSPSGQNIWISEGTIQISATPASGYSFSSWSSSGSITLSNPNSATTSATISGPGTITANFVEQSSTPTYTISPYASSHGSINPSVPVSVKQGADKTFTFTPDEGYGVSAINVDGKSVPVSGYYTFSNVHADHNISVTFGASAPREVSVTIDSSPSGQGFVSVDGISFATPQTFSWSPGSVHSLVASPLMDGEGGVRYSFSSWSDGGSKAYTYTVPNSPASVTADYVTQYQLTIKTNFGTVTPPDGSWYDAGSKVTVKAEAPSSVVGESYVFGGWKGSLGGYSGGSNPSGEFIMNGPVTEETTWQHIYLLTVHSDYGAPEGSGWYEAGGVARVNILQPTVSGSSNVLRVFTGWGGDASGTGSSSNNIVLNGPKTATAEWKTQYRLVFNQSGLDGGVKGVVLTVNGTTLGIGDLPYVTEWMDGGTVVKYAYSEAVTSSKLGEVITLSKVNGPPSPLTVEDSASISGSYNSQNVLLPWINLAFVIFAVLVSAILIILWRRNQNTETIS
jgi:hypothetical protein